MSVILRSCCRRVVAAFLAASLTACNVQQPGPAALEDLVARYQTCVLEASVRALSAATPVGQPCPAERDRVADVLFTSGMPRSDVDRQVTELVATTLDLSKATILLVLLDAGTEDGRGARR